ncbi:hypothetical protein ACWCPM_06610 [Streptomyces sp. NPDC002309]
MTRSDYAARELVRHPGPPSVHQGRHNLVPVSHQGDRWTVDR